MDKGVKSFERQIEDTKLANQKLSESMQRQWEVMREIREIKKEVEDRRRKEIQAEIRKAILVGALALFMRYFLIGAALGFGSFVAMNVLIWLGAK